MDLSLLGAVNRAANERTRLIAQIDSGKFEVFIGGVAQDAVIVELVTRLALGELRARLRRIEDDLLRFGVEIGVA